MPILSDILGKWNLVSSENFDEYMKQVGVSFVTRKLAGSLKPVLTFTATGDEYTMTSVSTFTTYVTTFKIGDTINHKTADGREVTSTFSLSGDKLIQEEKGKDGKADTHFERFIDNGKLIITCASGGVTCTRKYERA